MTQSRETGIDLTSRIPDSSLGATLYKMPGAGDIAREGISNVAADGFENFTGLVIAIQTDNNRQPVLTGQMIAIKPLALVSRFRASSGPSRGINSNQT